MTRASVENDFCYAVRAMVGRYLLVFFSLTALAQNDGSLGRLADLVRQGSFQEAVTLADSELNTHPSDKRILTLRGVALEKLNRDGDALGSYRSALKNDPAYIPALRGAAEIEFRMRDQAAGGDIDRLLRLSPGDQTAHAMRGVLAWLEKDCASAARHFAAAGPVLDSQPAALHDYGSCLVRQNRESEALAVFERIQQQEPGNRSSAWAIASLQLRLHRYQDAVNTLLPFEQAGDADALALLAEGYEGLGDTPHAVDCLRRAIVAAPDRPEFYVQFASLSFEHKSFQVGVDMLNAGLQRLPRSADLYLARGILDVQLGNYETADQDFSQAELLDPKQSVGSGAQALAALQAGRLDEAIESSRRNLKTHPDEALSWYVLSEVLMKRGARAGSPEFSEALHAAQTAAKLNPGFLAAGDSLSKLYLDGGQIDNAIAECRRMLSIDPHHETALYRMIRALKQRDSEQDRTEVVGLLQRLAKARKTNQTHEAEASRYQLVEPKPFGSQR